MAKKSAAKINQDRVTAEAKAHEKAREREAKANLAKLVTDHRRGDQREFMADLEEAHNLKFTDKGDLTFAKMAGVTGSAPLGHKAQALQNWASAMRRFLIRTK